MNKNEKLLRKISKGDRDKIKIAVTLIKNNNFQLLDFKKLTSSKNMYRVRIGKFRIKFCAYLTHNEIVEIVRRSNNTY